MIWRSIAAAALAFVLVVGWAPPAQAEGLKVQPTLLRDTLKSGEQKKGYIDISNPGDVAVTVQFSVATFRQVDDQGSLGFQRDEQVSAGVKLDLESAELGPKDLLRLYFLIDSTKLPTGDVFAVIFAETTSEQKDGAANLRARVGTLLVLSNGTPASHTAEISDLSVPAFQFGRELQAEVTLRNTAPEGQATGFFPDLKLSAWPYIDTRLEGPLLFAGRSRNVAIRQPGDYLGIVRVEVGTGTSKKSAYTLLVTGWYRWGIFLFVAAVLAAIILLLRRSRKE